MQGNVGCHWTLRRRPSLSPPTAAPEPQPQRRTPWKEEGTGEGAASAAASGDGGHLAGSPATHDPQAEVLWTCYVGQRCAGIKEVLKPRLA